MEKGLSACLGSALCHQLQGMAGVMMTTQNDDASMTRRRLHAKPQTTKIHPAGSHALCLFSKRPIYLNVGNPKLCASWCKAAVTATVALYKLNSTQAAAPLQARRVCTQMQVIIL
jgi:hypothetical protein